MAIAGGNIISLLCPILLICNQYVTGRWIKFSNRSSWHIQMPLNVVVSIWDSSSIDELEDFKVNEGLQANRMKKKKQ